MSRHLDLDGIVDALVDEAVRVERTHLASCDRCQTALEQAELRVRLLSDPDNPAAAESFPAAGTASGNSTDA